MNEADRPLENHEHALSPDELARLRRLLNGSPTNRIEPPDPYKNRNEAGLQSINSRLDLTQKVFAGVSLVCGTILTAFGSALITGGVAGVDEPPVSAR